MRFRKLRIAFSAACLIACVLLIVLWVRSNWWEDNIQGSWFRIPTTQMSFTSNRGTVRIERIDPPHGSAIPWFWITHWIGLNNVLGDAEYGSRLVPATPKIVFLGFGLGHEFIGHFVDVPYWGPVLLSAALALLPWIRWSKRFSLRTMLIATTLVALVLGAIVYVTR
jgi:hypothetical protein